MHWIRSECKECGIMGMKDQGGPGSQENERLKDKKKKDWTSYVLMVGGASQELNSWLQRVL